MENTFTAKAINDHKLIVASLNNIGSTYFAQEKIDRSLDAFFEALEVQRSYLIKYFGGQPQQDEMAAGLTREMGAVLTTMFKHSIIWHMFMTMDDESLSSFFLDTASSIEKTFNANASSSICETTEQIVEM